MVEAEVTSSELCQNCTKESFPLDKNLGSSRSPSIDKPTLVDHYFLVGPVPCLVCLSLSALVDNVGISG